MMMEVALVVEVVRVDYSFGYSREFGLTRRPFPFRSDSIRPILSTPKV